LKKGDQGGFDRALLRKASQEIFPTTTERDDRRRTTPVVEGQRKTAKGISGLSTKADRPFHR
jgi:hypothetical protein